MLRRRNVFNEFTAKLTLNHVGAIHELPLRSLLLYISTTDVTQRLFNLIPIIFHSPTVKEKVISGLYLLSTLQTTEITENETVQQG